MNILNKMPNRVKILTKDKRIDSINCETSRNCDLRCLQCVVHSIHAKPPQGKLLLSPEIFSKLTPILPYTRIINFDNHGEALLNPHLEEFIRTAKSVAPKIITFFTSTFQLMTAQRAAKLLESGLDSIQVSISGITKETYQKIIINGDFLKFINNLKDFHSVLKKSKNKLKEFSACITAMKSNLSELPFMPEFIARFGIKRLRINSALPFSSEMLEESLLDVKDVKEVYDETIRNAEKLGIKATSVLTSQNLTCKTNSVCEYPLKSFSVSYNGDICPCWMLDIAGGYHCYIQGNIYNIPYVTFGNISKENIFDILNGPEFVAFKKRFRQSNLPDFCSNCPVGKRLVCG